MAHCRGAACCALQVWPSKFRPPSFALQVSAWALERAAYLCSKALCNYTSPTFRDADGEKDFEPHNSGYGAQTYRVTVHIPELAHAGIMRFAVRRTGSGINDRAEPMRQIRDGNVIVPRISPPDLISLRLLKSETRQ